ncbi:MAG: FAD-dependent tricarballylate dehydrogenase TcuA [Legionella sp.]|uniref:FAD-dependent tricarballylate dehydrogenase TcuA n=1 Tax=Legionella sp. TaxID=459 RepID=UPI00284415DB|nr:FAD-dependent tricarballylate dehydrogenase TcuA [Legionella sp.]
MNNLKQIKDIDVLVIGGGNAGLCAAISAIHKTRNVVVIEKASYKERGGNSSLTMNFRFAHSEINNLLAFLELAEITEEQLARLKKHYLAYPEDKFYNDLMDVSDDRAHPELSSILVKNSYETARWLHSLGHKWEIKPRIVAGSLPIRIAGGGRELQNINFSLAERKGVHIIYECELTDLIACDNYIKYVQVLYKNEQIRMQAKTIILACGSYEANSLMRKKYLGPHWEHAALRGVPFNTGQGITSAANIGALLYGDYAECHATPQYSHLKPYMLPGENEESQNNSRYAFNYGVTVNTQGERFFDEGGHLSNFIYAKLGRKIIGQPGQIAYQIFDQKTARFLSKNYFDNGNYAEENTLVELGKALGIDYVEFEKNIECFNRAIIPQQINLSRLDGVSTTNLFPPKSNWALAINKPPFFGFPVKVGITFTYGGLKINKDTQVIRKDNIPFQNLFACGEIVGGLFWGNYAGGSGLMAGSVFGKIAGEAAAKCVLDYQN